MLCLIINEFHTTHEVNIVNPAVGRDQDGIHLVSHHVSKPGFHIHKPTLRKPASKNKVHHCLDLDIAAPRIL